MNRYLRLTWILGVLFASSWAACLQFDLLCKNDNDCKTHYPDTPYCLYAMCHACPTGNCDSESPAKDGSPQDRLPDGTAQCTRDSQCKTGEFCQRGACIPDVCSATTDCAVTQECKDQRCVPRPPVKCAPSPCPAGMLCEAGKCYLCDANRKCPASEQCLQGFCQPTSCQAHSDCRGGLLCHASKQCGPCDAQNQCDPKDKYLCGDGRCLLISQKDPKDSTLFRWSDGSYAASCRDYYIEPPFPLYASQSGVGGKTFLIQPTPEDTPFPVYCASRPDRPNEPGANVGWTLVMKIDGARNTFQYNSAFWTNTKTYQADKFDHTANGGNNEFKLASFHRVPVSQILIQVVSSTLEEIYLSLKTPAASLYHLLRSEVFTPFAAPQGTDVWKKLVQDGSLQNTACFKWEGLNVEIPGQSSRAPRVRIGILGGTTQTCDTPTAWLGIGGSGEICGILSNISAGNATPDATNCLKPLEKPSLVNIYVR